MVRGRGRPKKNANSKIQEPASESVPEEYEVERVESHQIVGKGKNAELQYLVKWKNYPASDNTWEPVQAVENAHQLVDDYWSTRGGEKQREQVIKQLQGGKKAPTKEKEPATAAASSKAAAKEDKPESKKRRAISRTVAGHATTNTAAAAAATDSTPKRKRAKASTPEVSEVHISNSYESEDDFDISDSEIENENFRLTTSWANVDKVEYVRRDEQDNRLYAIVRWKDAKLAKYTTSDVAKKAPLKLIAFYEDRLSFQED